MPCLTEYLAQVKERCEAATEGPWKWEDWSEDNGPKETTLAALPHTRKEGVSYLFPDLGNCLLSCEEEPDNKNDKHFIAHARTDVPMLLEMVEGMHFILRDYGCKHCVNAGCHCVVSQENDLNELLEKIAEKYNG